MEAGEPQVLLDLLGLYKARILVPPKNIPPTLKVTLDGQ